MSKQSSVSRISENDSVGRRFPTITRMEDVITNFFNQIVEYVIEDLVILDEKDDKEEVGSRTSERFAKDFKELKSEDLFNVEVVSSDGSKIVMAKRTSSEKKPAKSYATSLEVIREESEKTLVSKSSTSSSGSSPLMEEERLVRILFTNGNVYKGFISKRIMNGKGKYSWVDGTVYEGDFKDGFPTGRGTMILPDLSHYAGEFNQGLFHGKGFLNIVSTPKFYSGEWKNGLKHGQGWLWYGPDDWYEGGWANGMKEGFGLRHYPNGAKYRGMWHDGKFENDGIMIWENDDFYRGEWQNGLMHGEGEYIWKAFYNDTFAFPVQNTYKGSWKNGKRCGEGTMLFGDDSGLKLRGQWDQDFKHGDGYLVCGNGKVIDLKSLFKYDKPVQVECSLWSLPTTPFFRLLDLPIFSAPEFVDVGFYVEKLLARLPGVSYDKIKDLRSQEEKGIKHVLARYLPQLKEVYQEYATIAAKTNLHFQPVMVRLFLWRFYQDKGISKCGISLAEIDQILAENPKSCVDSVHNPFEPIYFWQFLMSLISVVLTTGSLEDLESDSLHLVSNVLIKKFFDEVVFAKENYESSLFLDYLDLAPIKSVYQLYLKIGEPHSARTFLKESCTRKGEVPFWCRCEIAFQGPSRDSRFGTNLVPIDQHIAFLKHSGTDLNDSLKHKWKNLYDFRHLGPKNVIRCLTKACPLIMDEGLVVNIDYPLTFIEFYETLLTCIFMVLELEMKKEKKILEKYISPVRSPEGSKIKVPSSVEVKKKVSKEKKRGGKKKKK